MLREIACKRIEQRLVHAGIGNSEIVDWVDEAPAEKVCPYAIHRGASEEGIVGRDQPIGQRAPRVNLLRNFHCFAVRWTGGHNHARDGMFHFAAFRGEEECFPAA